MGKIGYGPIIKTDTRVYAGGGVMVVQVAHEHGGEGISPPASGRVVFVCILAAAFGPADFVEDEV